MVRLDLKIGVGLRHMEGAEGQVELAHRQVLAGGGGRMIAAGLLAEGQARRNRPEGPQHVPSLHRQLPHQDVLFPQIPPV